MAGSILTPNPIARKITTLLLSGTFSGLLGPVTAQTNNPSVSAFRARGEGTAGVLPAVPLAQTKPTSEAATVSVAAPPQTTARDLRSSRKESESSHGRPWTVQDSVGVRYFVLNPEHDYTPGFIRKPAESDRPVVIAPDGRHFFFVSFNGDFATDSMRYRMDIFAVADVRKTFSRRNSTWPVARPLRSISLSSSHSREDYAAIMQPRWESSEAIRFVGVNGSGPRRIYRYDVRTGLLTALTDASHDVRSAGSWGTNGGSSVYASMSYEPWRPLDEYPMATIKSNELSQILDARRYVAKLVTVYQNEAARTVATLAPDTTSFGPWVSPDGKWAVAVYAERGLAVPAFWSGYEHKPKHAYRFMLVDIKSGQSQWLIDAPAGGVTSADTGHVRAFWSADSRHIILVNAALPLTDNLDERRRMTYVVDYAIDTHQWTVLERMTGEDGTRIEDAAPSQGGNELLITYTPTSGAPWAGSAYKFGNHRWTRRVLNRASPARATAGFPEGFTVRLQEGVNEPPMIVASEGRLRSKLTEADPALVPLWRARAQTFEWQESGARTMRGLLMLPRDYTFGVRVPLVIQGFSYEPDSFRPDGVTFSAFSAQALVAQGFAVLQVDLAYDDRETTFMTPREAPARVERIDSIVETLANQGIVDPQRVGLIGFSRSGYSIYYAITHPGRIRPAAAIVFDSITASYGEYVNTASLGSDGASVFDRQYGIGTFWENKRAWMEAAPSFNVDQVRTPVLFLAGSFRGEVPLAAALETIGAFRYCRRPFDYLFFPEGAHELQRPRERAAAMQSTVDWMNFWLLDREPDATTGDRAERWRRIRGEWNQVQSEEPDGSRSEALPPGKR